MEKWVVCTTADNCATNRKVARLSNLARVGCVNYLLNLDVQEWSKDDTILNHTVETLKAVMNNARTLKNQGILRTLTELKVILPYETRWSGVRLMIDWFLRIRRELSRMAEISEIFALNDASGNTFRWKCERYHKYMIEIDDVTKELQTRSYTFEQSRSILDELISCVENDYTNPDKTFYRCSFDPKRIHLIYEELHPYCDFESGVVKIQRRVVNTTTEQERDTCQCLLMEDDNKNVLQRVDNSNEDLHDTIIARHHRNHNERQTNVHNSTNTTYGNCDFIYGSAAEVEGLWSIAKHILTDERKGII